MKVRSKHALLSLFIAAALGGVVVADASAQSSRSSKKAAKAEVMYPEATRQEPGIKASPKAGKKLQKLIDVYNSGEDFAQTRARHLGLECHALGYASIGPSFSAIAQHYRHNPEYRERLPYVIRGGSAGHWGERFVMWPQASLSDA